MELIQELEVWYIIPAIRKELAKAMLNTGLKQVEIAKKLGLTKAAVNQYFSDKRGSGVKFNSDIKEKIKIAANNINNEFDSVRYIQSLINLTREEKVACQVHKKMNKEFQGCNVCFEQPLIQIRT